jgi:hypothetical protein
MAGRLGAAGLKGGARLVASAEGVPKRSSMSRTGESG